MLRQCARSILPALIEYVAKMAPLVNEGSISEQHLAGIGEVWKAFAVLFTSVPDDQREFFASHLTPSVNILNHRA